MDASDKKELKKKGLKGFVKTEKADIKEAKAKCKKCGKAKCSCKVKK